MKKSENEKNTGWVAAQERSGLSVKQFCEQPADCGTALLLRNSTFKVG